MQREGWCGWPKPVTDRRSGRGAPTFSRLKAGAMRRDSKPETAAARVEMRAAKAGCKPALRRQRRIRQTRGGFGV